MQIHPNLISYMEKGEKQTNKQNKKPNKQQTGISQARIGTAN